MVDLPGLWRLAAYYDIDDAGARSEGPLGPTPQGLLYYSDDGFVSVHLARPNPAPGQLPYLGYAGRWRRCDDSVVHHIEVCSNPAMSGSDWVRDLSYRDELLTLTGTAQVNGRAQRRLLEWRRGSRPDRDGPTGNDRS